MTIGHGFDNKQTISFALRFSAGRWKVEHFTPSIEYLNAVACASSADCVAVGGAYSDVAPPVELWDGIRWSTVTPQVRGVLSSIACPTVSWCAAVGLASDSSPLIVVGAGKRWTAEPSPVRINGSLNAISCASASSCVAVGSTGKATFAVTWNGSAWKKAPSPPAPALRTGKLNAYGLTGISCTSANACTAVGVARTLSDNRFETFPTFDRWNGRAWRAQPVPRSLSTGSIIIAAVSCTSATSCVAAGTAEVVNKQGFERGTVIVVRWNGRTWTERSGLTGNGVFGISCVERTGCTSVGGAFETNARSTAPLVLHSWTP
jgi:hypothetical protein